MTDLRLGSPMIISQNGVGRPITLDEAVSLKILVLGSACKPFPEGWIGNFQENIVLKFKIRVQPISFFSYRPI